MSNTKKMILASFFTVLTAIGAFIRIPLPFVPIVLQGLFVILSGMVLGSKWGAISQLAYVTVGIAGLPVFTGGGGIGYVFHPTFGYLIGFIFASYTVGLFIEKSKKHDFKTTVIASLIGTIVIYLIGVPYLALILKFVLKQEAVISYAVWAGCFVTFPGDIIKALMACLLYLRIYPTINNSP